MKSWKPIVFWAFLVSLGLCAVSQQRTVAAQKGGQDASDPYEVVPNWPQPLANGLDWTRTGAVFAESPNRVYVFQTGQLPKEWRQVPANDPRHPNWPSRPFPRAANRCGASEKTPCIPGAGDLYYEGGATPLEVVATRLGNVGKPIPGSRWEHCLLIVDANGKLIESWEQHNHLFTLPHGIQINPYDPDRHVWVTDAGSEQIFKFTHDGKLVMTVGEFRVPRSDKTHLGGPSGMAFLPNGEFYVTDGYKNSRVVKFSKEGKWLMEWGKKGTGPGEFNTLHSIEIGPDGRLYVGDRGNMRIQIFDKDGKYLSEIHAVYPNALAISKDQRYLYVAQGGPDAPSELRTYDLNGKLLSSWGRPLGNDPGQLWGLHDVSRDSAGNLYFAESWGGRAWKYRPKKGEGPIGPFKKNSF